MRKLKRIFLVLLCALLLFTPIAGAAYENVTVYYNDVLVEFSGAGAFYNGQDDCVMLPLRAFSEEIGATVTFDPDVGGILISIYNTTVTAAIGVKEAVVNGGQHIPLPSAPVMENGISYVPMELFTEGLNMDGDFDVPSMTAHLSTIRSYTLGIDAEEVRLGFGLPQRTDRSEQGFDWYVYNGEPGRLTMIGIANSRVVAYYLYGGTWTLESGLYCGMTASSANFLMRAKEYAVIASPSSVIYSNEEEYIVAYLDAAGERITSILYEEVEYKDNFEINTRILNSFSMQIFDLCNAYRTSLGEAPLSPDPLLSSVASKQANDMAEQNYFAHTDSHGQSSEERLSAAGYSECYYAEAIAEAYRNSFEAFTAMIAAAEYQTLASANFNASGCGTAYDPDTDGVLYYCQVFYAPID